MHCLHLKSLPTLINGSGSIMERHLATGATSTWLWLEHVAVQQGGIEMISREYMSKVGHGQRTICNLPYYVNFIRAFSRATVSELRDIVFICHNPSRVHISNMQETAKRVMYRSAVVITNATTTSRTCSSVQLKNETSIFPDTILVVKH